MSLSVATARNAKRTCARRGCWVRFVPERSTRRFCSDACRIAAHRQARPSLRAIVGKGTLAERGHDLYETPPEAVHALLAAEDVPPVVWEPACGRGALARVLRESGRRVVATDLVDYTSPDQDAAGVDFLTEAASPPGAACIVTNPPYKLAGEFAAQAIRLVPRVYLLLRLAFLESRRRTALLESGQLARVLVFRDRLPMMHRDGYQGRRIKGGALAFAWFVWDRAHQGPPAMLRISCHRRGPGREPPF